MRIIGGHDFYDTAFAYGRDTTLVYERASLEKAAITPIRDVPLRPALSQQFAIRLTDAGRQRVTANFSPFVVWFAGKRYGAIELAISGYGLNGRHRLDYSSETEVFWTSEAFREAAGKHDLHIRGRGVVQEGGIRQFDLATLPDFFADEGTAEERDWLIENGHAIARQVRSWTIGDRDGWVFDCDGLKEIAFAKVLDPFAAFQELSMYLGGVLARPGPEMVEIRDEKSVVAKKGFDRWSFRKPPAVVRS